MLKNVIVNRKRLTEAQIAELLRAVRKEYSDDKWEIVLYPKSKMFKLDGESKVVASEEGWNVELNSLTRDGVTHNLWFTEAESSIFS